MISFSKYYLPILIVIITILSLWNIGSYDLQEWDESRNGVNAFEMIQTNDFINLYYDNTIDTWNAKPPLMIWLIALSYKIMGYNEFALRFPAFLSTIIFFIFCFRIIKILDNEKNAFKTCFILISSKAILGNHIGLTADFDIMLIALLMVSLFYFILYLETGKPGTIFLFALFTGLSFYTKGTSSFLFLPGIFLFIIIKGKLKKIIRDKNFWLASFILLLIIFSWILLVINYGKSSDESFYGSKNSIETMFVFDTFLRLTSSNFETFNEHDWLFIFSVLDARLNIWNYFFYVSLVLGIYFIVLKWKVLIQHISDNSNQLVLLSICIMTPIVIILTFSRNQHNWYLAPVFMFVAYLISKGIEYIEKKWKQFYILFTLIFAFTFLRHVFYIYSLPTTTHQCLSDNSFLKGKTILIIEKLKQNINLYFKWHGVSTIPINEESDKNQYKGQYILIPKDKDFLAETSIDYEIEFDNYKLGKLK